jgi:hypothetical protein
MLPCDYIREALMTDDAKRERREADEAHTAAKAAQQPPLKNAGVQDESEYGRFEDLTRQLVNTPKPK